MTSYPTARMEKRGATETTATLKVGIWSRSGGFTLFELVVTMAVMGIVALLVIPRLDPFTRGEMRRTSRQLAGLIAHLTQESASTKETYRLYFNLDSNDYWAAVVTGNGEFVTVKEKFIKRRHLPEGITFESIVTPQKGRVIDGEVFTEFYPIGIEPFTIHLKWENQQDQDGEDWTLLANPLTGRVKISDRYIDTYDAK